MEETKITMWRFLPASNRLVSGNPHSRRSQRHLPTRQTLRNQTWPGIHRLENGNLGGLRQPTPAASNLTGLFVSNTTVECTQIAFRVDVHNRESFSHGWRYDFTAFNRLPIGLKLVRRMFTGKWIEMGRRRSIVQRPACTCFAFALVQLFLLVRGRWIAFILHLYMCAIICIYIIL